MKNVLYLLTFMCCSSLYLQAQSTYEQVYSILQSNCLGCHEGASPQGNLDLSGTPEEVYDRLFETTPTNPESQGRGYKLVDAGYPNRSSIFRKVNAGLYDESNIDLSEGNTMPPYPLEALADADKELIRQWIYFGAPETGEVIDYSMLNEYYTEGGYEPLEKPDAPAEGEGFQLHLGSIFLDASEEREFIYKYELKNQEPVEINRIEVVMNDQSHHFLFFTFNPGADADEDEGLEEVTLASSISGDASAITNDTKMVAGWAYSKDFSLPQGSSYTWTANQVLKFNYHLKNYSSDAILPCDIYINVYTQPVGTSSHNMVSTFDLSDNFFILLPGESTHEWTYTNFAEASNNDSINLWVVAAHTHQYGTDFDCYLRNSDGSRGEQIYEGFYDIEYNFNQGYYDYSEPPLRVFDEYVTFKASDGLIFEADYNNTSGGIITVGLTTADEMFGAFLQYMVGDISDITAVDPTIVVDNDANIQYSVSPNPHNGFTQINYQLSKASEVQLSLYDLQGKKIQHLLSETQQAGVYQHALNANEYQLQAGIYMLKLQVGDQVYTKKVVQF